MLVKVAGSISSGARANRHSSEFAAKHSIAALVKTTVRVTRRPGFALMDASRDMACLWQGADTGDAVRRDCRSAAGNVVGEPRRIVADAGQEGGFHPGQPLQADEVQSGHVGDAAAVNWLAAGVQYRHVDPAEVTVIAGRPDHRADAGAAKVQATERFQEAGRIGSHRAGRRLFRHVEAVPRDVCIGHVEEGGKGGIAKGQAVGQVGREVQRAFARCFDPAQQRHSLRREVAKIDGVAAIRAGDQRQRLVGSTLFDGGLVQPQFGQPPDEIPSSISTRQATVATDRKIDAAAGANELFGDLGAGGTGADDQHRPGGKLVGVAIATGVNLKEARILGQQGRDYRALIGTGGDNHIARLDRTVRGLGQEAARALAAQQCRHRDAAADRRGDELGIGGEEIDDLRARGEGIRVSVRKGEVRQLHRPVGELEPQAVPALRPPTFGDPTPLEHEMPAAAPAQHMAQRQPGLAAADDQRFCLLNRHGRTNRCS